MRAADWSLWYLSSRNHGRSPRPSSWRLSLRCTGASGSARCRCWCAASSASGWPASGASGFLLKDTVPADLHSAIRVVAAGDALLAPSVTRRLIGEFARLPATAAEPRGPNGAGALAGLTEREIEVLTLVTPGMSNAEITDHLTISPATAKTHVGHLLAKLGSRDRVQLVIIGYQSGLVGVT